MAKFTLTFKDPDYSTAGGKLTPVASKLIEKFVLWGEYVEIEIDTEKKTARVVPVAEQEI